MSLFLFLIPAAIGGALTGYYGDFDCDDIEDYISESTKKYATLMKNEDILKEALHQYGMEYSDENVLSTYSK